MKKKAIGYTGRILIIIGFLLITGGVGRIDMAVETGEILSKSMELSSYLISVSGFLVCFLGYKLMQKFDK